MVDANGGRFKPLAPFGGYSPLRLQGVVMGRGRSDDDAHRQSGPVDLFAEHLGPAV